MEAVEHVPPGESVWIQRGLPFLVISAIIAVTTLHYLTGADLLEYHTAYRSLYYLPIAGAAVAFGLRGGLLTALAVIVLYLPHALGINENHHNGIDDILELPVFLLVGGVVGLVSDREHTQRRRGDHLHAYINTVIQSLPVGLLTGSAGNSPVAQNRVAQKLLPAVANLDLSTLRPGYHILEQGEHPLGLYVSQLCDEERASEEKVYVLEDLTERRTLETQLRRMHRLASVGQLAAGMAHEIRNPLTILRATAQLLAEQLTDQPGLGPYANVMMNESDRIERLIGELLAYARPRPPHHTPIEPGSFLGGAAQELRPYALQHEIQIAVDPSEATTFWADAEQMRQVLINLLLNAVQATQPGGIVKLRAATSEDTVIITVSDTGCGMTPDVSERACDPFFTTRHEGTGLGLALVSTIIQEHGGLLTIDSTVGVGTTVTLTLPQEATNAPRPDRRR